MLKRAARRHAKDDQHSENGQAEGVVGVARGEGGAGDRSEEKRGNDGSEIAGLPGALGAGLGAQTFVNPNCEGAEVAGNEG